MASSADRVTGEMASPRPGESARRPAHSEVPAASSEPSPGRGRGSACSGGLGSSLCSDYIIPEARLGPRDLQKTFTNRRRKWQPPPVFLPGESHGRRSLVGYSPRGRKESVTTQRLHFHFHQQATEPSRVSNHLSGFFFFFSFFRGSGFPGQTCALELKKKIRLN